VPTGGSPPSVVNAHPVQVVPPVRARLPGAGRDQAGPVPPAPVRLGLTGAEAHARLARDGPNELPRAGGGSLLRSVRDVGREPMFLLLLAAGALYLLLGDTAEALLLFVFATLSVVIAVVQELRTERALEALRDLSSPRALVLRGGVAVRIPGREVVAGDLVLLVEGDRVPADATLLEASALEIDESLLTGESVPVAKAPSGDAAAQVFSGTLVVRGRGQACVTATGGRTEMGRIGHALGGIEREPPRLRTQMRRLVRVFAVLGIGVSVLATLVQGWIGGDWAAASLGGIALAMAMLPEEFPLILTVFTVMGARRMARAGVLARRAAAIESLGAATVLCTDKTGTLTENRMALAELALPGTAEAPFRPGDLPAPPWAAALAQAAALASRADGMDPMDRALVAAARGLAPGLAVGALVRDYPLRDGLPVMAQAWRLPDGLLVAAKGAPEAVLRLVGAGRNGADEAALMAARGLRVLAVAEARLPAGATLPERLEDASLVLRGLVGLADPLRASVPEAVRECRAAGIRILVITGDHPATAAAIARDAGLAQAPIVTGAELAMLGEAAFRAAVSEAAVFARILPAQKLRIVEVLKADGQVVAMTGDGVNDAPALKAAHIGVAMGGRGTDVAREAASLVVLDDDFGSVVRTVRLGRRIFDNLRKAMGFVVAMHVPIAGLALLPPLLGLPPMLLPVHIAFMEMIVDPVCSIAFEAEPEEADVMRRKPRDPEGPLLPGTLLAWSLAQGVAALVLVSSVMALSLWAGAPSEVARSRAFLAMVLSAIGLILVNRAFGASLVEAVRRPNAVLGWVLMPVALLLAAVLAAPPLAAVFSFGPVGWTGLVAAGAASVTLVLVLELAKYAVVTRRLRA
jgi:Ca2+-transporting ATPase